MCRRGASCPDCLPPSVFPRLPPTPSRPPLPPFNHTATKRQKNLHDTTTPTTPPSPTTTTIAPFPIRPPPPPPFLRTALIFLQIRRSHRHVHHVGRRMRELQICASHTPVSTLCHYARTHARSRQTNKSKETPTLENGAIVEQAAETNEADGAGGSRPLFPLGAPVAPDELF